MQKKTKNTFVRSLSRIHRVLLAVCLVGMLAVCSCVEHSHKPAAPSMATASPTPYTGGAWTLWTSDQIHITAVQTQATELVRIKGGNIVAREKISPPWNTNYSPYVNYAESNGLEFLVPTNERIFYRAGNKSSQWHVLQIEGEQCETHGLVKIKTYKNTILLSFYSFQDEGFLVYAIDTSAKSPTVTKYQVPDNFVVDDKGLLFIDAKRNVMRLSPRDRTPHKICILKSAIPIVWTWLRLTGEVDNKILFHANDRNLHREIFWGSIDMQGNIKPLPASIFSDISSTLIRGNILWLSKESRTYGSKVVRWNRKGYQEIKLPVPFAPVQSLLPCQDKNSVIIRAEDYSPARMYTARVEYDTTLKVSPMKTSNWHSSSVWSRAVSGNTIWIGDISGSLKYFRFP